MEEVLAPSHTADPTFLAVELVLTQVIVVQVADSTKIGTETFAWRVHAVKVWVREQAPRECRGQTDAAACCMLASLLRGLGVPQLPQLATGGCSVSQAEQTMLSTRCRFMVCFFCISVSSSDLAES